MILLHVKVRTKPEAGLRLPCFLPCSLRSDYKAKYHVPLDDVDCGEGKGLNLPDFQLELRIQRKLGDSLRGYNHTDFPRLGTY